MKITVLMENTAVSERYLCRHGLSLYIETQRHKVLFDMGPDASFLENAKRLGGDISQVDVAFLSHGHYDHGGGLSAFLQENSRADVHVQAGVFGKYYAHDAHPKRIRYIGLDSALRDHSRLVVHRGGYRLDEELEVFSGVRGRICASPANDNLYWEKDGKEELDTFEHEQNLLVHQEAGRVLVCGCAHNGIVNILSKAEELPGGPLTQVIGGLHLNNIYEEDEKKRCEFYQKLASHLMCRPCEYYTCHCTGVKAYEELKKLLGEQIHYLSAGAEKSL